MNIDLEKLAKPNETIKQHTNNIIKVSRLLIEQYMPIIERMVEKLPFSFFLSPSEKKKEIESFILEVIQFHDYGKVNPFFQKHIKEEARISKSQRKHAIYSFYMWLIHNMEKEMREETLFIRSIVAFGSISGHHNSLKEFKQEVIELEARMIKEIIDDLKEWGVFTVGELESMMDCIEDFKNIFKNENSTIDSEYVLFFCKFVFSLMVTSDSISSSEISSEEYEQAVEHLFRKDIKKTNFHEKVHTYPIIDNINKSPLVHNTEFKQAENMNDVRILLNKKTIASYCEKAAIYILEAPVGTGKTLSSISLVDELIRREGKKKVISVFPLNSVQTQYVETISDGLGVDKKSLNVINSESLFGLKDGNEEQELTFEPNNLWLFERNCFSSEFIITSHVRFFQTFRSMKRKEALGFLNLFDSVVVIDEFQNYPPKYWFSIWNELLIMSEMMGTKWVFTTGTFPVSEIQLSTVFGDKVKKALSTEENEQIFNSPFVKGRSQIVELKKEKYDDIETLADDILDDIQIQERNGHKQFIVCVSFVNNAKKLYHVLSNSLSDYCLYFLCGRHSSEYKKELMKKIQKHNSNRNERVLLVTTKTVECGMDFDFDHGYKEFDMFDSVEQLSGRVNRSNKREGCGVKTFRFNRKLLEHEKLYHYNDDILKNLQNKLFIPLYEDMYKRNKITISNYKDEIIKINKECAFEEYKKQLTMIDSENYCTDIILIKLEQEEQFIKLIERTPKSSYAESVVFSMKLRKELEQYRITVTNKWLNKVEGEFLIAKEENGISYFLVSDDEKFDDFIETYQLDGMKTFLEKDPKESETYEFY